MNLYKNYDNDNRCTSYLNILAKQYPTIDAASTEIINLKAILNLPKGTEHFLSDIHGENESFDHVLKNASGAIKQKIDDVFGNTMRESEKKSLATLIYYPEQKLELIIKTEPYIEDWYKITLFRLVQICKVVSAKYTRSKVRKALPEDFKYILEELIHEESTKYYKHDYYNKIIETIIELDRSKAFIIAISRLIQRLIVDRLHIIGDIYDRGPGATKILDTLANYHSIDVQWGNHDIMWMGAAAGSIACICNVIRISSRYCNLQTLEEDYGINLVPLATFAMDVYGDDPCTKFMPLIPNNKQLSDKEKALIAMMHKAVTVIQFKVEAQIIKEHPEFGMEDRLLLDKINFDNGTVLLDGKEYALNDANFPTVSQGNPYELTEDEGILVEKLISSFVNCEKLQKHTRFLFAKGSMYLSYNSNLLYHGCIPLNEDGTFAEVQLKNGKKYTGKDYIDKLERIVREGYFNTKKDARKYGMDMMWYLWCGAYSPLFGKKRMTVFESYFIQDESTHEEVKNPYYKYRNDEGVCVNILNEFDLDPNSSHIINGHVPVRVVEGENPVKANGKLLVIDGGLSKAYQSKTGIAGYTLIYKSNGLFLASHEPFESTAKAIAEEKDILSTTVLLEYSTNRKRVADTDIGKEIEQQIEDLTVLLNAYREGLIKEQR